jgi:hypothetical protein
MPATYGSQQRRKSIQAAMLATNTSIRELTRASGFMSHQVMIAVHGAGEISEYVHKVLIDAIGRKTEKKDE